MRTYYCDDHVHITSAAIWVDGRRYDLFEVERAWRRGGSVAARRVLVAVGVLVMAVFVRAAFGYESLAGGVRRDYERWLAAGTAMTVFVAVLVLGAAIVGVLVLEAALRAIEDIRGRGRHHELWATVRGTHVMLWRTNDTLLFGKVTRALVRALADRYAI
jgi:Family of unknown function (DUF6232)